jgi:hypothetical protein
MRPILIVSLAFWLVPADGWSQTDSFAQNFKSFKDIAPGVDFYAASREQVIPFQKPVAEARQRLGTFLGELAPGAVVVCSTLAQKDTVSEARLLRMGYRWALIQLTLEASNQEMLARIKGQQGGEVPERLLQRLQNPTPEMKQMASARLVSTTAQRAAYAILMTTLAPEKPFRTSRLDDVARSPLADWLDMGLVGHASGVPLNLRFLQDRIEEAFPIEDILGMSRPFVVPDENSSGGGGGGGGMFVVRMGDGAPSGAGGAAAAAGASGAQAQGSERGSGGGGGGGGGRRGGPAVLPKDVQDRMMFDGQASTFFAFLVEKISVEKVKKLVQSGREGKDVREILTQPDMLGPDMEKVELAWIEWLKAQKAEPERMIRMSGNPSQAPAPPR